MGDYRIKDLEVIKQVLDKHGVRFYIVYGAVLGFHRDGKFLPGDDDIDLAIIDPIDLKTRKAIGWTLYDLGFKPQNIVFNVFNRMEPMEIGYNGSETSGIIVCERNFKFTIFFFHKEDCEIHGPEYVCIPKLGAHKLIATPQRFFEKPDTLKINKKKYLIPGPVKEYLAYSYGDGTDGHNWKDKNDRYHSPTYFENHETGAMIDLTDKNQLIKYD